MRLRKQTNKQSKNKPDTTRKTLAGAVTQQQWRDGANFEILILPQ